MAVKARKNDYIGKKTTRVKIGTWNVAAMPGTDLDLGAWFVEGQGVHGVSENISGLSLSGTDSVSEEAVNHIESVGQQEDRWSKKKATYPESDVYATVKEEHIGIYALGLQEVVDINSASETLRAFADSSPARKWRAAIETALPPGYQHVAEQQMSGLLLLVYASPDLAASITSVSTITVGTGLMGYMGNKGAVCARLVLGESTRCVFINSHLAAGSDKPSVDRRNWDFAQISSRARFEPSDDDVAVGNRYGDGIGDEDFAFWCGDLNYRLDDIPDEDVRRLLLLHTQNEYDVANTSKIKIDRELSSNATKNAGDAMKNPGTEQTSRVIEDERADDDLAPEHDPASLYTTLQSLLPHDQLRRQQESGAAFHNGWREGEIRFLPTYKYDIGSVGMFDSSEKTRGPSWCDRILYRTKKDRLDAEQRMKEKEEARKKDAELKDRGLDAVDEDLIFENDPGTPAFPGTPGHAPIDDYDEDADAETTAQVETSSQPQSDGQDGQLILEQYFSHPRVLSSDHKPLEALFKMTYDAAIPELKAKVQQEVARELDRRENEGRPVVTVVAEKPRESPGHDGEERWSRQTDSGGINFGQLRYGVPKHAGLTIANTGSITATFLFVDRPHEHHWKGSIAPPWLTLEVEADSVNANPNPNAIQEYMLSPGDTMHVSLSVNVEDFKLVRKLNDGSIQLDDFLVLRVKEGRDHFVPLSGNWMQSCLSRTLEELVLVPDGGVRQLQGGNQRSATSSAQVDVIDRQESQPSDVPKLSAPRELFSLIEAVHHTVARAMAEWGMTQASGYPFASASQDSEGERSSCPHGWPFDPQSWTLKTPAQRAPLLASIRENLDNGSSLKDLDIFDEVSTFHQAELMAETLVTFLDSLQDGIVSSELWRELDSQMSTLRQGKTTGRKDVQSHVLDILSTAPLHNVAFTFITFTLSRVTENLVQPNESFGVLPTKADGQQQLSPQNERHLQLSPTSLSASPNTTSSITTPDIPTSGANGSVSPQKKSSTPASSTISPPRSLLPHFASSLSRSLSRTRKLNTNNIITTHDNEAPHSTNSASSMSVPECDSATSQQQQEARLQAIHRAYATIFANVLVRKKPAPASASARTSHQSLTNMPIITETLSSISSTTPTLSASPPPYSNSHSLSRPQSTSPPPAKTKQTSPSSSSAPLRTVEQPITFQTSPTKSSSTVVRNLASRSSKKAVSKKTAPSPPSASTAPSSSSSSSSHSSSRLSSKEKERMVEVLLAFLSG